MANVEQEIEPQKFTDAQIVLQYLFGGKSTFTLQSTSGERFTYKVSESVKRPNDTRPPVFFVTVLTGPDNVENYNFVGTIFERKTFKFSPRGGFKTESPSIKAFVWAFNNFVQGVVPESLEFWPSTHCARCGRPLTVPESIENGFGPECITKVGGLGNGQAPIVGNQQTISANPISTQQAKSAMQQQSASRSNEPSDDDVKRMVTALQKGNPERFFMDGEISDPLHAYKFWFKRYKQSPMAAAELAELEAQ